MLFTNFILENYVMLFELIGVLVIMEISVHIPDRIKRLTVTVVFLLLIESLIFTVERWTQSFETLSPARPLLTYSMYTIYPIILLILMQITVTEQMTKKTFFLLLIPEFISIPLYFTSMLTHMVCWFSEDNRYHPGPLRLWPYAIFGLYTLIFLIHNIRYFRHSNHISRVSVLFIVIGPVLGVVYYKYFETDYDYSALFASAILLYYIYLYIHMAKIDPLTKLLNRQSYYQEMNVNARSITGVASVDMNELKYLNDNFGHEAGDEALKTVAEVMRQHCGNNGSVFRIGGDEFIILYANSDEAEISAAIDRMRQKMAETPYTCAFGFAMKKKGSSVYDTVLKADEMMYADKEAIKQAFSEAGKTFHSR
ncbi:MAG: GGDEF domain-containing protein [Oscillospiraceae bacterium]|nr:GGDEF domain-containing protein [Oscillospiraceae bacterium]